MCAVNNWAMYTDAAPVKSAYKPPTQSPTNRPINPSGVPSTKPVTPPTPVPSAKPTAAPSTLPSATPSGTPTNKPVAKPTSRPTAKPVAVPSAGVPSRSFVPPPAAYLTRRPSRSRSPSRGPTKWSHLTKWVFEHLALLSVAFTPYIFTYSAVSYFVYSCSTCFYSFPFDCIPFTLSLH